MISVGTLKNFKNKMRPVVEDCKERKRKAHNRLSNVALIKPHLGQYDGSVWADWLVNLFLPWFLDKQGRFTGFADFHAEFWEWVFNLTPEDAPKPYVGIIFREGAKSTMAEMSCVRVGGEELRRYGWYICNTQDQANDHISNVSGLMQSASAADMYPHLAKVAVDENSRSLGWRASRLSTAPKDPNSGRQRGFTLDAIGLDKAKRGGRLDEDRPDFVIFDDVDDEHDTIKAIEKKLQRLSQTFLPATAANAAVLFIQNIPNPHGIAARLVDNTAGILSNRILSGPHPLVKDLTYQENKATGTVTVTGGSPTWPGFFPMHRVQETVTKVGLKSLLVEYQHERYKAGGLYLAEIFLTSVHVIPRLTDIPSGWKIDRSFDWGKTKPYAATWWAESDGSPIKWHDGKLRHLPKGTLIAIGELYGWNGRPNEGCGDDNAEIARKVKVYEGSRRWGGRVEDGPADASIFDAGDDGESIADRMEAAGVKWKKANKGPGSRIAGGEAIVGRFRACLAHPMEKPGMYITEDCPHMIRTFQVLPKDPANPDDVDTNSEDHVWDLTRYRVLAKTYGGGVVPVVGT